MVNAYDLACRGDKMVQDGNEVAASAPDVEDFGAGVEIWEEVFSGVSMLSWHGSFYEVVSSEAAKNVPCEGR